MAHSITRTIADLKVAYSKFETSGGESNRYTIESQTARYRELMKAADGLFDPPALKRVADIYERDSYRGLQDRNRQQSRALQDCRRRRDQRRQQDHEDAHRRTGCGWPVPKKFWERRRRP